MTTLTEVIFLKVDAVLDRTSGAGCAQQRRRKGRMQGTCQRGLMQKQRENYRPPTHGLGANARQQLTVSRRPVRNFGRIFIVDSCQEVSRGCCAFHSFCYLTPPGYIVSLLQNDIPLSPTYCSDTTRRSRRNHPTSQFGSSRNNQRALDVHQRRVRFVLTITALCPNSLCGPGTLYHTFHDRD